MEDRVVQFGRPAADPPGSWGVPALLLGAEMRRERGSLTQRQVTEKSRIRVSASVYSRIENGETRIDKPAVVEALLEALGVPPGPRRQDLLRLAHDASAEGWASTVRSRAGAAYREAVPDSMLRLTSLEEWTERQIVIDTNVISGVLQTPRYRQVVTAKTLLAGQRRLADRIIDVRRRRAEQFVVSQPRSTFFIYCGALYADFGETEMMIEQLTLLLRYANDEKSPVAIRVIEAVNPLAIQVTALIRLSFAKGAFAAPDVIYTEAGARAEFHRGPLAGEEADSDYLDYQDLSDTVIKQAPGLLRSRELITNALEWHRERLRSRSSAPRD
ncbi:MULTISPECIES: Scr1 family TA system antitoxin-like transcriptional regulator [unclassified Streptomyces]|uniref:Scr1 family TA system antitoxin-like transcriptional regulator n=1 Tax=unclassified Streptomyces TaxID=2593676 RepID=UPI001F36BB46|nr:MULTISPECIES: Scr1 family TA system antitoxin-like transcriptional regulator [unclassified Streptomyces]WKE71839.1 Scr1 family TA system antitoxin-like transcriptional regulator [Streptomyces sp. WP-1]